MNEADKNLVVILHPAEAREVIMGVLTQGLNPIHAEIDKLGEGMNRFGVAIDRTRSIIHGIGNIGDTMARSANESHDLTTSVRGSVIPGRYGKHNRT
ncbi:MAG: hypothetical protein PHO48_02295 [Candidatus Gracilibacteria bacterium]|nr:hypothetical protein [Candidatus Gracilibacteria bacterium]MDD5179184.1 hypothetical protein [Candidatus Gracilibacteria bacterium]